MFGIEKMFAFASRKAEKQHDSEMPSGGAAVAEPKVRREAVVPDHSPVPEAADSEKAELKARQAINKARAFRPTPQEADPAIVFDAPNQYGAGHPSQVRQSKKEAVYALKGEPLDHLELQPTADSGKKRPKELKSVADLQGGLTEANGPVGVERIDPVALASDLERPAFGPPLATETSPVKATDKRRAGKLRKEPLPSTPSGTVADLRTDGPIVGVETEKTAARRVLATGGSEGINAFRTPKGIPDADQLESARQEQTRLSDRASGDGLESLQTPGVVQGIEDDWQATKRAMTGSRHPEGLGAFRTPKGLPGAGTLETPKEERSRIAAGVSLERKKELRQNAERLILELRKMIGATGDPTERQGMEARLLQAEKFYDEELK